MTKINPVLLLIATSVLLSAVLATQKPQSDISAVVAAGKLEGDVYRNSYFGISLSAPKAKFTVPSLVNVAGKRARLVDVVYDSGDGALNYTIAVLADSRENYSKDMPLGVYVRSLRHQLEKHGLITAREEFSTVVSGVPFTGAILKVPEKPNFGYFRGIYSTFLNGYLVSIDVQGRNEERINKTLSSVVKIEAKPDAHVRE
jgi:hypothetical protein